MGRTAGGHPGARLIGALPWKHTPGCSAHHPQNQGSLWRDAVAALSCRLSRRQLKSGRCACLESKPWLCVLQSSLPACLPMLLRLHHGNKCAWKFQHQHGQWPSRQIQTSQPCGSSMAPPNLLSACALCPADPRHCPQAAPGVAAGGGGAGAHAPRHQHPHHCIPGAAARAAVALLRLMRPVSPGTPGTSCTNTSEDFPLAMSSCLALPPPRPCLSTSCTKRALLSLLQHCCVSGQLSEGRVRRGSECEKSVQAAEGAVESRAQN